jgi:hypothetical protein
MTTQGTQGTQGTPQQAPPIPKMEAAPAGTRTARQIRDAVRADAKAAVKEAIAAAKAAQQPPPGQQTTSTGLPPGFPTDVPTNVTDLGMAGMFMIVACVLGFPIVRVIARRFDPKVRALQSAAPDVTPQLQQLQESVDAMAIELERISEGQRYATKLLSERAGSTGKIEEKAHQG